MGRLAPIDRLRGLVMVLMTSDHAAHLFYTDHLVLDSVMMPGWDGPLPALPFLHRWLSHLCAPTFVFLAGTSIVLSAERRRGQVPERAIDRELALRGLLLIALDATLLSWLWGRYFESRVLLQVLYAIGAAMLAMIPLRRLPARALLVAGLALVAGHEALAGLLVGGTTGMPAPWIGAVLTGGFYPPLAVVAYPLLPWLGVMLLGAAFGRRLADGGDPVRALAAGAAAGLATWLLVRGLDGYGNFLMTGARGEPLRWLQLSKYPPSLAFLALELGLSCAILAGLFAAERRRSTAAHPDGLLLVLGQTALFFYLAHVVLLEAGGAIARAALEPERIAGGLGRTWLAVGLTVALLYPACRAFRAWKRRSPRSLLRLL